MKLADDFRTFLFKQNFLALALAVVIGGAVGKVVTALVDDVIMPIVGVVLPNGGWREAAWQLNATNSVKYGDLLGRVVDFLIIAFVVFLLTRMLIKEPEKPAAPATKDCPFCLELLPLKATRCRACTSQLTDKAA